MLIGLWLLPGYGQEVDSGGSWLDPGEALTEMPLEPADAIAPDGSLVLDFAPPVPTNDVVVLAAEITSRPEFQSESVVQGESLIERLLRWLSSLPGIPAMGSANWLVVLLLAALLGLITYLVIRLTWAGRMRRQAAGQGSAFGKSNGRQSDYLEQATLAAHSRKYREAVRFRFLYVLQQAGLPDNQMLTNLQVQRELIKRNATVKKPLTGLISGYEDAWYGQQDCTQETYDFVREVAEAVEKLLNQEQAA